MLFNTLQEAYMRAPIGIRSAARRKAMGVSQAELSRRVGISPSYLNLISAQARCRGGVLLRIAAQLDLDIGPPTGEAEHRLWPMSMRRSPTRYCIR